jgi:hypothetical protein
MGTRFGTFITKTIQNPLPASAVETVIFVTGPIILATDGAAVYFNWSLILTTGAGTTALYIRIRRGVTITGTLIAPSFWNNSAVPAAGYVIGGVYVDTFAASDTPYCLTVSQQGATAAGVLTDGCLHAFVL